MDVTITIGCVSFRFVAFTFLTLGPKVQSALLEQSSHYVRRSSSNVLHLVLWPFMIGAALSGSLAFLVLVGLSSRVGGSGGGGGCMGLSAVTMSMLSVYAHAYPDHVLGILIAGVLPVRLPAHQLLQVTLLYSLLGSLYATRFPQQVEHSAHLGGLVFGILYNELLRHHRTSRAQLLPTVLEQWWTQQSWR